MQPSRLLCLPRGRSPPARVLRSVVTGGSAAPLQPRAEGKGVLRLSALSAADPCCRCGLPGQEGLLRGLLCPRQSAVTWQGAPGPSVDFKHDAAPCPLREGDQALPRCFTALLSLCSSSPPHGSQPVCAPVSSHSQRLALPFSQLPGASLAVHPASTSVQRPLRTAVEMWYLALWEGGGTSVQEPWLEARRQQRGACQTHSLAALHSRVGGGRKCFVCARLNEVAHEKSSMPFSSSGLWQIQEDSDMFVPRQS